MDRQLIEMYVVHNLSANQMVRRIQATLLSKHRGGTTLVAVMVEKHEESLYNE